MLLRAGRSSGTLRDMLRDVARDAPRTRVQAERLGAVITGALLATGCLAALLAFGLPGLHGWALALPWLYAGVQEVRVMRAAAATGHGGRR